MGFQCKQPALARASPSESKGHSVQFDSPAIYSAHWVPGPVLVFDIMLMNEPDPDSDSHDEGPLGGQQQWELRDTEAAQVAMCRQRGPPGAGL